MLSLSYEELRSLCGTAGLVIMFGIFLVAVLVTYWPGRKSYFQKQASSILEEETHHGRKSAKAR